MLLFLFMILLNIHYLCGRNDNKSAVKRAWAGVVICSKFITFVVEMTTDTKNSNYIEKRKSNHYDIKYLYERRSIKALYTNSDKDKNAQANTGNTYSTSCSVVHTI